MTEPEKEVLNEQEEVKISDDNQEEHKDDNIEINDNTEEVDGKPEEEKKNEDIPKNKIKEKNKSPSQKKNNNTNNKSPSQKKNNNTNNKSNSDNTSNNASSKPKQITQSEFMTIIDILMDQFFITFAYEVAKRVYEIFNEINTDDFNRIVKNLFEFNKKNDDINIKDFSLYKKLQNEDFQPLIHEMFDKLNLDLTKNKLEMFMGGTGVSDDTTKAIQYVLKKVCQSDNMKRLLNDMLSCKLVNRYIYDGFTQLVDGLQPKMNKIDVILNNEISHLFLYIFNYVEPNYNKDESFKNKKLLEKDIILSIFVKNYPDVELLKMIKTVGLFEKFLNVSSEMYFDNIKIFLINPNNLNSFIDFLNYKKININQKRIDQNENNNTDTDNADTDEFDDFKFFLELLLPSIAEKKINVTINNQGGKMKNKGGNITKRKKPCKKGTRWVSRAQKCMTPEEKKTFIETNRRNNQNLANVSSVFIPLIEEEQKEVVVEVVQKEEKVEKEKKDIKI